LNDLLQDARGWAKAGYMDVLVPMTYFHIKKVYCAHADWACLLDDHVEGAEHQTGRQMYIGIDGNIGAREIVTQIKLARARGASGISIFSFGAVDDAGIWSVLANGVFAQVASVPPMPWKQAAPTDVASGTQH
jgi:uncharacterized lipoprotein YddW (UPF0748 family)